MRRCIGVLALVVVLTSLSVSSAAQCERALDKAIDLASKLERFAKAEAASKQRWKTAKEADRQGAIKMLVPIRRMAATSADAGAATVMVDLAELAVEQHGVNADMAAVRARGAQTVKELVGLIVKKLRSVKNGRCR